MKQERVLVLLKQFLGDAVMTEPLLTALAANYQKVDVLCSPTVHEVLRHLDGKVSFVHGDKPKKMRDLMEQGRKLRLKQYDIAFLVNRSFRSAILARLAKIPDRVGHGTEGRAWLLTKSIAYDSDMFEARSYTELAEAMGIPITRTEPELQVNDKERAAGKELAQGADVMIQPGARWDYKKVPAELLADVANALIERGHKIVFVGGPEEEPSGVALAELLNSPPVNLIGKTKIRETLGVLSNMRVGIGGDTGVLHLTAALGVPTVTVFGPTPAIKWGHHYAPHRVLQAKDKDLRLMPSSEVIEAALTALNEQ